ncbi:MAG: hypothetical protein R6U44_05085 [Archaeoglobaceae archaeon]
MRKNYLLSIVIAAMVCVAVGFMAVAAMTEEKIPLKKPSKLTEDELNRIYENYNVSENDIKFAKGELPHFLRGTILDGTKKVIATENGKLDKDLKNRLKKKNITSYNVIEIKKMKAITEKAKKNYIKKYGVDPANPEIDVISGISLPKGYVEKLVEEKILNLTESVDSDSLSILSCPRGPSYGPHAIDGELYFWIFPAMDSEHNPTQDFVSDTDYAINVIELTYNVDCYRYYWYGRWDASDVGTDSLDVLKDLQEDWNWLVEGYENELIYGWVDNMDHNGRANLDGIDHNTCEFAPCSVGAVTSRGIEWPDWPHDSIFEHEVSHSFNAVDQGTWWYEHPRCVMNYYWAWQYYDTWCDSCWSVVDNNINV